MLLWFFIFDKETLLRTCLDVACESQSSSCRFFVCWAVCNIFYAGEIGLGTFLLQKNWLSNNKIQVYFKYIAQPFFVVLIWLKDFFDDFFWIRWMLKKLNWQPMSLKCAMTHIEEALKSYNCFSFSNKNFPSLRLSLF